MTCEECGERSATIRYTEMVDGKLSTWNLCEDCARKKGVAGSLTSLAAPLVNILMGLIEEAGKSDSEEEGPVCPQCGLSYAEFRRSGRMGCGTCYESFREEIRPLLRRVHGSTRHAGRVPTSLCVEVASERELARMRAELKQAIRREEYERAAELRDAMRATEEACASSGTKDVDVSDDDE